MTLPRAGETRREDIPQVVLEEASAWIKQDEPGRALELVPSVLGIVPDDPATPLLEKSSRTSVRPRVPRRSSKNIW